MPERLLRTDPRFWVLSEALSSYASDDDDPPIRDADRLQAAVSVVIRGRDELELLLIKRARSERDPWSGHMALPGGRRDRSDPDLAATARRETLEETGVDLARVGAPLGRLADVAPSSVRLPKLTISAFVFGVPGPTTASVASYEIERVLWVPLDALRDPAARVHLEVALPGGAQAFPSYRVEDEHVWGLTYRIVSQFLERYPDDELARVAGR